MADASVFFLSDAHFSNDDSEIEREKRRRLSLFLESIRGAEHLYVVGDLFDFWFEFRRCIPRGFTSVLAPLRELVLSGTPVTLIGGNHDYWLGSCLSEEFGLRLAPDGLIAEHQGRRLLLEHGDETLSGDRAYLALKSVIRHPWFIAAARLLHPDFTYWAADLLSARSRKIYSPDNPRRRRIKPLRVRKMLSDEFDAYLFGHLHIGFHYEVERWEILCLGDWNLRFSYVELSGGELKLMDDRGNHYPREAIADPDIPPADRIFGEDGKPGARD
jgi:UDP-2,3-diacylglucosamine hydrolase